MNHAIESIRPIKDPDEAMALAWLMNYATSHGVAPTALFLDAIRAGGSVQAVLMDRAEGTILRLRAEDEPELHESIGRLICEGKRCAVTLGASGVKYDPGYSNAVGAP